ncbi:exodeoxyribonuclease V subunit alpha [Mycolicibacterium grossiae]|uniref:RecBCD enzyme subunit RecD n=1 Tax=Mycolicibacterium grossiae TaxID=1552759 RepID=A0A1E8QAW2_9MYCO|nr:exodeoxyribonuclease V subunit alpha [Mycolicibacterium grossiae]OFJ55582.1 exodeoxyribonuclease V subunit alpha [Mycolicibacterium grossiae]QEM45213.1 exodeoxyribonuclease V subunit alpha [Mycolicibacterium grossiae]
MTSTVDEADWRRAVSACGLLAAFNAAGVLDASDVLVAQRLCALGGEDDERVALAVAFTVRGLRGGSVCVELRSVAEHVEQPDLPWPEPDDWLAAVRDSALLAPPHVLRLRDEALYLDRYWREEQQVADDLRAMITGAPPVGGVSDVDRLFPAGYGEQRAAAELALTQRLTVLTGGPGTGKTTTVARLLALLAGSAAKAGAPPLRIALAAPTGKAAARLQEAVRSEIGQLDPGDAQRISGLQATTLHRLLGSRPDSSSRFRHHRGNRLPHDVVVVDETSMVSLTMMARLLEAVRPEARVLLVGDPDQLASVDAGAVLADLVEGFGGHADVRIAELRTPHRFGESIGALAAAIRAGADNAALEVLRDGGEHVEWLEIDAPGEQLREVLLPTARDLRRAALLGDAKTALATLDAHRLLCAHRHGPHGVTHWNRQVERWLTEETGEPIWSAWYVGRPVLVTANDYGLGLYNGDVGVTLRHDTGLRVAVAGTSARLEFAPGRLADVETMHAMTIHKSQGSQAAEVTVLLPPVDSRLLTRELFYTAVTRAKTKVRVVGSADEVRAAIGRRAVRATGLAARLRA